MLLKRSFKIFQSLLGSFKIKSFKNILKLLFIILSSSLDPNTLDTRICIHRLHKIKYILLSIHQLYLTPSIPQLLPRTPLNHPYRLHTLIKMLRNMLQPMRLIPIQSHPHLNYLPLLVSQYIQLTLITQSIRHYPLTCSH